jgi:hypothetical protein
LVCKWIISKLRSHGSTVGSRLMKPHIRSDNTHCPPRRF